MVSGNYKIYIKKLINEFRLIDIVKNDKRNESGVNKMIKNGKC